jgi:GR25 family glycosyltransferase involved in LPS biosynthesis
VENELKKIGICGSRFNAIRLENGALGCSMSHLKCIQHAKENNLSHVLICEDDIQFLDPELFKKQLNGFLKNHPDDWDVVLLAGNNMPPYEEVGDYCVKISRCQTTTGYMVNGHYFDTLIENIKTGIQLLMREPQNHRMYAVDKYWFQLQQKDNWYLITPLTVIQKQNYSDIENRVTNYSNVMLDLDKKIFFTNQLDQINAAKQQLALQPISQEQINQFKYLQQMEEQIKEEMKFFDKK